MKTRYSSAPLIATFCGLMALSAGSHADPKHPALADKWQFDFSVLSQKPDATVRSTVIGDTEVEIDLGTLGADDRETTGGLGVRYAINDKWRAYFAYSPLGVSGSRFTNRTINFDGTEFPLNTGLDTDLDITTYVAAIDYAFHQSEDTEWGVGAGLHAIDLGVKFEANLNAARASVSEEDLLAPLPNLRVYFKHALSEKWIIGGSVGWMSANVDKYDGELLVADFRADYRFNNNWTLGANYQLVDINLEIDDSPNEQAYDIQLPGFGVRLTYSIPK